MYIVQEKCFKCNYECKKLIKKCSKIYLVILQMWLGGLDVFNRSRGVAAMLGLEGLEGRRGTKIWDWNAGPSEGLYKV